MLIFITLMKSLKQFYCKHLHKKEAFDLASFIVNEQLLYNYS